MTEKRTDWPELLKWLAAKRKQSHAELAAHVGISRRVWRSWVYGERTPSTTAAELLRVKFPELAKRTK